jgi:glutamate-5-semialdehyde dehydrogenase
MAQVLNIKIRDAVLLEMAGLINTNKAEILAANKSDLEAYQGGDLAMYDRLKLDDGKIEGMVSSLEQLAGQDDPLGVERYRFTHPNGMEISNRTSAFGTVFIIYESRPDVTIEAAGIAFKSGNHILLKGGKESLKSNKLLTGLWHQALQSKAVAPDWVKYLEFNREETRAFLQNPSQKVDLIVPRGGEKLIAFVKEHASCPVIVSGRGNNFLYVDRDADRTMAQGLIINAKTTKISACNALDKVLIDRGLPEKDVFISQLIRKLKEHQVSILADTYLSHYEGCTEIRDEAVWQEEFLDYRIVLGEVEGLDEAIATINRYSGGHSAAIVSADSRKADKFMEEVDSAAVYHNASTRFTDGGQFGLGGELAISTDKLHQRGPLGLQHLITNKWYVHGTGQARI